MKYFPFEYFRNPGPLGVQVPNADSTPQTISPSFHSKNRGIDKQSSIPPVLSRGSNVPAHSTSTSVKRTEDQIYAIAIKFVLSWEGGYVNNPNDSGGATNKGITQHTYNAYRKGKGLPNVDVKQISDDEVADIYRNRYWVPAHCKELPDKLAVAHMDTTVNGGGLTILNRTLGLPDTTKFGTSTLAALNKLSDTNKLVASYLDNRDKRYDNLAVANPKDKVFLKGWHNRVAALRSYVGRV